MLFFFRLLSLAWNARQACLRCRVPLGAVRHACGACSRQNPALYFVFLRADGEDRGDNGAPSDAFAFRVETRRRDIVACSFEGADLLAAARVCRSRVPACLHEVRGEAGSLVETRKRASFFYVASFGSCLVRQMFKLAPRAGECINGAA